MEYNILHITDLHLHDFQGTNEFLRKWYFEEYIDGLVEQININVKKVNAIVVTGDLVDKGRVENFSHVREIINYLSGKLSLSLDKVCFCIGNHDFKYKEEDDAGANSDKLREPFRDFCQNYPKVILFENRRITLSKLEEKVFYLSIDSTLGSYATSLKGKPGKIEQDEIDIIIKDALRTHVSNDSLILIGCHYPILHFPSGFVNDGEEDWEENHMWKSANALRVRINKIAGVRKLWLMGDCHIPDHLSYEGAFFVLTGRFGGGINIANINNVSHIPRQCKVICLDDELQRYLVHTFNFESQTHKENPNYGKWEEKITEFRKIEEKSNSTPSSQVYYSNKIELIDDDVEERIISRVAELDLYSFGRYVTSSQNTSLGWVNTNRLLNSTELLSRIVAKSIKYFKDISKVNADKVLVLGLDFWGAIIGSQISVRTGVSHFAMPTRGSGEYHSSFEVSNPELDSAIKLAEEILFVIDVISCGDTLCRLADVFYAKNSGLRFNVISVISNENTINVNNFKLINKAGTFCQKLKIPVISNVDLPDELILPANINLSAPKH